MQRIGLALSGGGFRAAVYHLGVIRYLRDAGVLPKISHITSVSGGSVTGAHLALNWERYCGSDSEFNAAASEVIRFVQMDVRNRIVRRFPLCSAINTVRRVLRLPTRRHYTRAGLLEQHYEKHLFGDRSLFELPDRPRLHILATNLSEGCLCSFFQGGLLLQKRTGGRRDMFEKVNFGLATVPMAVAASSAFPGFFPPLELHGWDVGTVEGEFNHQAFTDGGVIDNLGLRMFRCIEQSWVRDITPLSPDDVLDVKAMTAAINSPATHKRKKPLGRLRELMEIGDLEIQAHGHASPKELSLKEFMRRLWEVVRTAELYYDPAFANIDLSDANAKPLLDYVRSSHYDLDVGDRLWLNRHLVNAAFAKVAGAACLNVDRQGFDKILVSDAGATFKVAADGRAGGLITTAMRSSDIAMDRVYQLELEAFKGSRSAVFLPMTEIVTPAQDAHAPHPEIQRQSSRVRTDMDCFSDLEISALVQHGYCVTRKRTKELVREMGFDVPDGPAWHPFAHEGDEQESRSATVGPLSDERHALDTARSMRHSSKRRIWRTLLSVRDWPTYVWVPLLLGILLAFPYTLYKARKRAHQQDMVLTAVAETSPLYREILDLLEGKPLPPMAATEFVEVDEMKPPSTSGFDVVKDARIYDLRKWSLDPETDKPPYVHQRIRIRRTEAAGDETHLRIQIPSKSPNIYIHCKARNLDPKFSRMRNADGTFTWEVDLNFGNEPIGVGQDVVFEGYAQKEAAAHDDEEGRITFSTHTDTGFSQVWLLMPEGRESGYFEISSYPFDHPEDARVFEADSKIELPLGALAMFRIIDPNPQHRYECRWKWSAGE
ncbi:MAG: patatin-like phospholipase family protein [Pirellulales bacterium]|nr:patatin-like phospholipase family protein [Pirellulales bacterium]